MQMIGKSTAIQYIIRGQGTHSPSEWRAYFNSQPQMLSSLILRGKSWNQGCPPVAPVYFRNYDFDIEIPACQKILDRKINFRIRTIEIFLFSGLKQTFLVRIAHGIMDARGGLAWITQVLQNLDQGSFAPAWSKLSERDLLKVIAQSNKLPMPMATLFPVSFSHLKSITPETGHGFTWKKIVLPGRDPSWLPRLAKLLSTAFRDGKTTFLIPTDLRRHLHESPGWGNFTLPLFLPTQATDTWLAL